MSAKRAKIAFGAFFAVMWVFLPHDAQAVVLQGVHNYYDENISAGAQQGQAFTGIDDLESISLYTVRIKTGGSDLPDKALNVYNVQCYEDSTQTTPCPDGSGSLDGSGYIKWNLGDCIGFTTTSSNIPMNTCNVGAGSVPREIFATAFITVPYLAEQRVTLNPMATTTHNFNPNWYYFFNVAPVAYPGHTFGDKFQIKGSLSNVYPTTSFVYLSGTSTTMADMYFEYGYPGETVPGEYEPGATTPAPKNIEILEPTYGTTTATTTFMVQVKYKTPLSLDFRPSTTRHFRIVDALTGEIDYQYNVTLGANESENVTITATATALIGSKFIRAMYLDMNGNAYSEIDEIFFNVATNTYFGATGRITPRDTTGTQSQLDCTTFDIGCQFQKALQFLFVPSSDTLDRFSSLWQSLQDKKPFGYVTVTINQLKALDTTGAQAFDLGTIPFMDSIFTPFRTLFAGILWALFAIYFYTNRLRHLDI